MKLMLVLLALTVALAGCSDGSSTRAPTEPTTSSVNGSVTKGPVAGATVLIYSMDASGEASGEPVAGPVIADDSGAWSANVPDSASRPLLVEATGGSYTDEATGTVIQIGDRKLRSFLPAGASSSSISPASEVVVRAARQFLSANSGATLEEGIESGIKTLRSALGITFDPLTVTPDPNAADVEPRQYAAILGGLSTLANNQSPGTDPLDTVIALVDDASDGEVDGKSDGNNITIGNSADTLPVLSGSDVTQAVADFTSSPENGDFSDITNFTVTSSSSSSNTGNGTVTPQSVSVFGGSSVAFTLSAAQGSTIGSVTGCPGTRTGNVFETEALSAACQLDVRFDAIRFRVSVAEVTGGSADTAVQTTIFGRTASFTLTADTGYELVSASGCGGSLTGSTFTTGSITGDCTVVPVFELQQRDVVLTASPANGGTVDPSGTISVDFGSSLEVTITPATGFDLNSVDNGQVAGCEGTLTNNSFAFDAVTEDCELTANFTPSTYTVTGEATGPGTISPVSQTTEFGDTASFTLVANTSAGLADVVATGCTGTLSANVYTTGQISSDCTVTAEFRNLYTITATAGTGGSISPTTAEALEGEAKAFDLTPETGFETDTVTGCNGTLTGNSYITGAITTDCQISATFTESPLPAAVWDNFNWDEAVWQ